MMEKFSNHETVLFILFNEFESLDELVPTLSKVSSKFIYQNPS